MVYKVYRFDNLIAVDTLSAMSVALVHIWMQVPAISTGTSTGDISVHTAAMASTPGRFFSCGTLETSAGLH